MKSQKTTFIDLLNFIPFIEIQYEIVYEMISKNQVSSEFVDIVKTINRKIIQNYIRELENASDDEIKSIFETARMEKARTGRNPFDL